MKWEDPRRWVEKIYKKFTEKRKQKQRRLQQASGKDKPTVKKGSGVQGTKSLKSSGNLGHCEYHCLLGQGLRLCFEKEGLVLVCVCGFAQMLSGPSWAKDCRPGPFFPEFRPSTCVIHDGA